jgi:hypothetical protein
MTIAFASEQGKNGRDEPPPMPVPSFANPSHNRWPFSAALLAAGVLALVGAGCSTQMPSGSEDELEEEGTVFEPGPLGEYLPQDTAAVLTLNIRQVTDSRAAQQRFGPRLQPVLRRMPLLQEWLARLGVDPPRDLDRVQVIYPAGDLDRPLLLLQGRFDHTRFDVGPGRLCTETAQSGGRPYRLYRFPEGEVCAVAGDTLVLSGSRRRVLAALDHAAAPESPRPPDAALAAALEGVDRGQDVWLAVAVGKLGPLPEPRNRALRGLQKDFLRHTESIRGGAKVVGDDLTGDFFFRGLTEDGAAELETLLRTASDLASGAELWLDDKQYLPLLKFLGSGTVTRDGKTVRLHCRVALDDLGL